MLATASMGLIFFAVVGAFIPRLLALFPPSG
jgi:hypothetical protein